MISREREPQGIVSTIESELSRFGITAYTVFHTAYVDSTMNMCRWLLDRQIPLKEGTILVADRQSSPVTEKPTLPWFAAMNDPLFTVAVPAATSIADANFIHLAGSAAVVSGIRNLLEKRGQIDEAQSVVLKYPNDMVVLTRDGAKKLAGAMLADPLRVAVYDSLVMKQFTLPNPSDRISLLGIGINNSDWIEKEYHRQQQHLDNVTFQSGGAFQYPPISLQTLASKNEELPLPLRRSDIIVEILKEHTRFMHCLRQGGRAAFLRVIEVLMPGKDRSLPAIVETADEKICGTINYIDDSCVHLSAEDGRPMSVPWESVIRYQTRV
jgi:biotin-(acetyl-CoA carboxylase) ligase